MLAEPAFVEASDQEGDHKPALISLPALTPVDVGECDGVEELLRAASASMAVLSLRLESALRELRTAERADDEVDLQASHEFLVACLLQQRASRRRELATEMEHARADAVATIETARRDADGMVATAWAEAVRVLRGGHGDPVPLQEPEVQRRGSPDAPLPAASEVAILAQPAPSERRFDIAGTSRHRAAWARYLYADVILPVIAVLVVLIVLLAWVG